MFNIESEDTIDIKKNSSNRLNIQNVSILFSIIVVLNVVLEVILSFLIEKGLINLNRINEDFYGSQIIIHVIYQIFFILAPPIVFLIIFKIDIKKSLKIKPVSFLNTVLIFFIMCFSLPVMIIVNLGYLSLLKYLFGMEMEQIIPLPQDVGQMIIGLLVIGIFAGVFEEVLFRGVILQGYRELGAKRAIILTGFLFGMFHFDIQRFLGTFLLGILIGFIVYRTGSLISGIFAHVVNNSVILLLSFLSRDNIAQEKETEEMMKEMIEAYQISDTFITTIFVVITILISLVFIFGFVALVYTLYVNTKHKNFHQTIKRKLTLKEKLSFLWLVPGLAIICIFYSFDIINALNN